MDRPEPKFEGKLALAMSIAERKLIDNTALLNEGVVAAIRQTAKKAVQLSLPQLDDLADALSAKANHTEGRRLQQKLDTLVRKIDRLTSSHLLTLLEANVPSDSSADLSNATKNKPTLAVTLTPTQREVLKSV
jgi:hypothetical protein